MTVVPVIDIGPLIGDLAAGAPGAAAQGVAAEIDAACRDVGFFTVVGHGIDPALFDELERLAREFFARPEAEKARIAMEHGGRAWRGWFPVGGELTSGRPDHKEGLYVGAEHGADDPRVRAGLPLHGPNLFPAAPAALGPTILRALDELTTLGHRLVAGIGMGLGLGPGWFDEHLTADPVVLFRIFHYPPADPADPDRTTEGWGVGEHTDYGLLTLLRQDTTGGLQVRSGAGSATGAGRWLDVEPVPDAFVCNLGDMLDRMTGGRYRATAHRVRVPVADRISCPFFFDPSWDAEVVELPLVGEPAADDAAHRWDGTSLRDLHGTYGEYLVGKVEKVFPGLAGDAGLRGGAPLIDRVAWNGRTP